MKELSLHEALQILDDLEEQAKFSKSNKQKHAKKHNAEKSFNFKSEEDYGNSAEALTLAHAKELLLNPSSEDVMGYITQSGRKVKIKKIKGPYLCQFVSYIGDDSNGDIITYFVQPWDKIVYKANPYISGNKSYKYKSDLNGKFNGLNIFMPPLSMTEDEYHIIRNKIIRGDKL